jgi:hypothetical protein
LDHSQWASRIRSVRRAGMSSLATERLQEERKKCVSHSSPFVCRVPSCQMLLSVHCPPSPLGAGGGRTILMASSLSLRKIPTGPPTRCFLHSKLQHTYVEHFPPGRSQNLFRWKCQVPGPDGTEWEGGLYPLTMEVRQHASSSSANA